MMDMADGSGPLMLPPSPAKRRTPGAATTLDVTPNAEIAQARVFERLLQTERAELAELARTIDTVPDAGAQPDQDLTQIRARLDEIHGLLVALHGRFPRRGPDLEG